MDTTKANQAAQLNSALPCISIETIDELIERGLLHFDDEHWRFGDSSNGATRKLNTRQKWMRGDNEDAAWHRLIGLNDVIAHHRKYVLLAIEGSKDAPAAAEIAYRSGVLSQTGIFCALGSGYRPIRAELEQLRGRWVGVIGDNDAAGIVTTELVSAALNEAGVDHGVWQWVKCQTNAKDLYDWLKSQKGKKWPDFAIKIEKLRDDADDAC